MKNTQYTTNRPGGFIITDAAINFCSFPEGAKILDLGCGSGATVDYVKQNYGFDVYGLDKNLESRNAHNNLINASAEEIPFPAESMDGVIMECSLSVMEDQDSVLKECDRVLKADGFLIISDMYARGEPAHLKGKLGCIDTKENLINILENNGFTLEFLEDFSNHLQTMWGQMIFEKGAESFYADLGVCAETLKSVKCGYCLIIARKKDVL